MNRIAGVRGNTGAKILLGAKTGGVASPGPSLVRLVLVCLAAGAVLAGCSIKRMAVDIVGDAITGGGTSFQSDEDPELVRQALPFGLKTYESMLEVSPEHRGLLLESARGFTAYAYLLQNDADQLEDSDLTRTRKMRARARKLYLRGRNHALRGLEANHPGFKARLFGDRAAALAATTREDVDFLYWAGAAWAGALGTAKDDLDLLAELPVAGALVGRVLELDDKFDAGTAHEFFVSYEGSRPGGSVRRARRHYRLALTHSKGGRASVHLALAEAVSQQQQNLEEFKSLLAAALAVDPDEFPQFRLVNTVAHTRARWLEARIPALFVEAKEKESQK
ncbi:MAG: TRAP transporter TatT component family protein [Alphaproteobacteria bacterium]